MRDTKFSSLTTSEQNNVVCWFKSRPAKQMIFIFPFLEGKLDKTVGLEFVGMTETDWNAISSHYISNH